MALAGSKFDVITLTPAASERVRDIVDNAEENVKGLRIGVKNGGCAGMSYTMDLAETEKAGDESVSIGGVTVYIDPKAVLFLLGTQLDYEITKLRSGFVFNNPNQTSACGCGESVALTAADPAILQS